MYPWRRHRVNGCPIRHEGSSKKRNSRQRRVPAEGHDKAGRRTVLPIESLIITEHRMHLVHLTLLSIVCTSCISHSSLRSHILRPTHSCIPHFRSLPSHILFPHIPLAYCMLSTSDFSMQPFILSLSLVMPCSFFHFSFQISSSFLFSLCNSVGLTFSCYPHFTTRTQLLFFFFLYLLIELFGQIGNIGHFTDLGPTVGKRSWSLGQLGMGTIEALK